MRMKSTKPPSGVLVSPGISPGAGATIWLVVLLAI
jgi:hypothetical protein